MSKTVDERVVEMKFDNGQFEKNVNQSMSTIDKLKQKLKFSDSAKGLDNLNSSVRNVNMSPLGSAVETVHSKFSALQIMGVTALANITNSAVNAGKKIVSALTINPVKDGLQEYELQINSVQTIMANTGEDVKTVNAALDKLNTYADKTIYNFTEMTQNAGMFTAALGTGSLNKSMIALKGIGNWAAYAGAGASDMARASFQLAQGLQTGIIRLQDWMSIEHTAGMSGKNFQKAFEDTARSMGINVDEMIKKGGSFRESLRYNWLTTDVFMKTMEKFAANDAMTDAATKVKTFTQLIDTTKEALGTGWAQIWRTILGDFEQAKELFTSISDFLNDPDTGIISVVSNAINDVATGALGGNPFAKMAETINKADASVKTITASTKKMGDVVNKVIVGDFGNGEERFKALTKAGYNWKEVQNKVNEQLGNSYRYTVKNEKAQKNSAKSTGDLITNLVKLSDAQLKNKGYTDDEVKALRTLQEQSEKTGIPIKELIKDTDKLSGRSLLINSFKNMGKAIMQVFSTIKKAWEEIFPPKSSEEKAKALYSMIGAFHKFTTTLKMNKDTVDKLKRTFKGLFAIIDVIRTVAGGGLRLAFKLINSVLKAFDMDVLDVTANVGDAIVAFRDWLKKGNLITKAFDKLGEGIKMVIDFVKDLVKKFSNLTIVQKTVEGFKDIGRNIVEGLKDGISLDSIVETMKEFANKIVDTVKDILGIHSPSKVFYEIGGNIIQGLVNGISDGIKWVIDKVKWLANKIASAFKGEDSETMFDGIISAFKKLKDKLSDLDFGPMFDGIISAFKKLKDKLSDFDYTKLLAIIPIAVVLVFAKKIYDITKLIGDAIGSVTKVIDGFAKVEVALSKVLDSYAKNLNAKALKNIAIALALLVASVIALTFIDSDKLYDSVAIFIILTGILAALALAVSKMSDASVKIGKGGLSAEGLKMSLASIGAALLMMAITVRLIGNLKPDQAKRGFIGLAGMMAGMLIFITICGKVVKGKKAKYVDKFGTLMRRLAVALIVMVGACKLIGKLKKEEIIKGISCMAAMVIFTAALIKVSKLDEGQSIGKVGRLMKSISVAVILMAAACKLIGKLDNRSILLGMYVAKNLAKMIFALMLVGKMSNEQQMAKIGRIALSLGVALLLMTAACKIIGGMEIGEILKGVIVIGIFSTIIGLLMEASKLMPTEQAGKFAATLIAMSIALTVMAGIAVLLGMIPIDNLAKGIGAIAILGIIVALMIKATAGATKAVGNILAMTAVIAVLSICIAALSTIDGGKLAGATIALGALMSIFAGLLYVSKYAKGSIATIAVMAVVIAALAGVVYLLAENITDFGKAYAAAGVLALMLAALVGALVIMNKWGGGLKMAASLLIVSVGLLAIAGALKLLAGISIGSLAKGLIALAIGLGLIIATVFLMQKFAVGAGLLVSTLLSIAAVAAAVGIAALAFAAALYIVGKALPIVAEGLVTLITSVASCVADAGDFLITMYSVAAGLAVLGLAAIVAGAGVIVLAVGILALGAAFVVLGAGIVFLSLGALVLAGALALIGLALPLLGTGINKLVTSVAACSESAGAFVKVMALVAAGLALVGIGAIVAGAGFVVMAVGAMALAGGILMLSVALLIGAGAVALLSLAFKALGEAVNLIATGVTILASGVLTLGAGLLTVAAATLSLAGAMMALAGSILVTGVSVVVLAVSLLALGVAAIVAGAGAVVLAVGLIAFGVGAVVAGAGLVVLGAGALIAGVGITVLGVALIICAAAVILLAKAFTALGKSLNVIADGVQAGVNLVKGFVNGIKSGIKSVVGAVKNVASSAINGIKNFLGIHSPSTIFSDIGGYCTEGMANGIDDGSGDVMASIKKLGSDSSDEASQAGSDTGTNYMDAFNENMDFGNVDTGDFDMNKMLGKSSSAGSETGTNYMDSLGIDLSSANTGDFDVNKLTGKGSSAGSETGSSFMDALGIDLSNANTGDFDVNKLTGKASSAGSETGKSYSDGFTKSTDMTSLSNKWGSQSIFNSAKTSGTKSGNAYSQGVNESMQNATAMDEITNRSLKNTNSKATKFKEAGSNLVKAFNSGIGSEKETVLKTTGGICDAVASKLSGSNQNITDIYNAGTTLIEQFNRGIAAGKRNVYSHANKIITHIANNFKITSYRVIQNAGKAMMMRFNSGINIGKKLVYSNINSIVLKAATIMKSSSNSFKNIGKSIIKSMNAGVIASSGTLAATLRSKLRSINQVASSASTMIFKTTGKRIIMALDSGITSGISKVRSTITKIMKILSNTIEGKLKSFTSYGNKLMSNLATGISEKKASVKTAVSAVVSLSVSAISSKFKNFYNNGKYLGSGLALGIAAKEQAVYNAAYKLGQKAVKGEKDGQKSNSPSKLTIQAGKWLGEGLVIGINKMGKSVYKAGHNIGEEATNSISNAISSISDVINSDIDAQPTIRPVMDLSDIESGANSINNLLGEDAPINAFANVRSINTMMNRRNQNGANDDVVDAINSLNKKLDNVGGTTSYNINGITYDDGSSVSNAIGELVRAARIERRI